ncbi:MAG: type II secretion system protein N [Proteobacteria bacterium]|nr:type II secretion system protein N [Pseudomonadota bacterium]
MAPLAQRPARRRWRWAAAGASAGAAVALALQPPASWLAQALADATGGHLLLADARGSLWHGSAALVLSGGSGARQASALPGRLQWSLGLADEGWRPELRLQQPCCIEGTLKLGLEPGIGRLRVSFGAGRVAVGRWPASWLVGLGAPFNTLQPGGSLQLSADALSVESVQGRWRVNGQAELELLALSSALSPLDSLGSYRLQLSGGGPADEGAKLNLVTLRGPLNLSGAGQWVGPRLRFRGQARADAGSEALLNNLLNLMGQRQGALALLAIG